MQPWAEVTNGLHRLDKANDILYKALCFCVSFGGEVMIFCILIGVANMLKITPAWCLILGLFEGIFAWFWSYQL